MPESRDMPGLRFCSRPSNVRPLPSYALAVVAGALVWTGCQAAPGVEAAAFASGKPKSQVAWQRTSQGGAVRHGWYRSWHENGRLYEEGLYVQGNKQGVWSIWDAQGRKRGHEVYDGGKRAGRWLAWHANGRLARQEQYAAGAPHGPWHEWDESGRLVKEVLYDRGISVDRPVDVTK